MLRTCQINALTACNENNKGIIRMCCGSGKTMVEIELCLQENISCLVAPRNSLLKQHILEFKKKVNYQDFNNEFKYSFSTKTFELYTINCESDFQKYKGKSNKKVCFLINNCSLTKLPITPDILIVDEAHTHKIAVFKSHILKDVKRKYFFTATPQDMTDIDFYGPVINTYDYLQALTENYVTPFKIVPIWKKENYHIELQEKMDKRNLSHCIHFYQTIEKNENFNLSLLDAPIKKLKNAQKITNLTKNRDIVFNKFKQNGGHLLSCQTISYGINIPECDSVFLSYIGQSIPDTVQKMMRAIRLSSSKKDKIAYIFVLLDIPEPEKEYDEENLDITPTIKELQQQLVFKIAGILKEGLDLDVLRDYYPYNIRKNINILKEEKEELLKELEVTLESENTEINDYFISEEETRKIQIEKRIEEIDNNTKKLEEDYIANEKTIKKSSFLDFFDDYQLKTWYVNGEIKSKINYNNKQWEEKYKELKKLNGKMPSSKTNIKEEKTLGCWINLQKTNYKKKVLSEERIKLLESLDKWKWAKNLDDQWTEKYQELKKLNEKMPSRQSKVKEEKSLSDWVCKQRTNYKQKKLPKERIKLLESLDKWKWKDNLEEQWKETYDQLQKLNGEKPSTHSNIKEEKSLGRWACTQRRSYNKGILSSERIKLLESLDKWKWEDNLEEQWQVNFEKLKKLNGEIPSIKEKKTLHVWCCLQKTNYKKKVLSEERIKLLESLDKWKWEKYLDEQWKQTYDKLKKLNGNIPSIKEDKTLYNWGSLQKINYKKGILSYEKIKLLESLDNWEWEHNLDEQWKQTYDKLKKLNGKMPSKRSEIKEEKILGYWINLQKTNYKKKVLSEERIKLLESLDKWEWAKDLDDQWKETYDQLKKLNGKMPSIKEEKSLYKWCFKQRTNYKEGILPKERIKLLELLPEWQWTRFPTENVKRNLKEPIQESFQQKTNCKVKNQTTEEILRNKYINLSQEQLLDLLIKKDLQSSSNYTAPNKEWKEIINKLFSENINKKIKGDIIVLDDIDFYSSNAVKNVIGSINSIVIPNNGKSNEEMSRNTTFKECLKQCSLQELLDTYISNQKPIRAIYADLQGALVTEISVLNQIKKCNLTKDCVIGFTIAARSNTGAEYTNEYATTLVNTMYKTFRDSENLIDNSGVYVYGEKIRMATCVFKKK